MDKQMALVRDAWNDREGAIVFTTVDGKGMPNSIYATCTEMNGDGKIVIANNYFNKTKNNIESGSKGVVLFITAKGTSYQAKGSISYETSGENYDFMKSWNPEKHPGHAATVVSVEQFYSGGKQLF